MPADSGLLFPSLAGLASALATPLLFFGVYILGIILSPSGGFFIKARVFVRVRSRHFNAGAFLDAGQLLTEAE